ncbi:hypothetical protein [Streptomyces sp. NPDC050388]|uniref:hypothetical protein n=1 Tax=Streptomyces sp. NPDC050388 TaxID=3155781 RepID=UPI00341AECAD
MTTVTPNPHSPYANADPNYRHIFGTFVLFGDPEPGALTPTACKRLAVVPEEPLQNPNEGDGTLPEGLCPGCVSVMQGGRAEKSDTAECGECDAATWHGELCALCRIAKHDEWWPTRDQQS